VLNVGLSAGIINQRLFSMFVVEALVLTFITAPFTVWIYPARHREGYNGPKIKKGTGRDSEEQSIVARSNTGSGGREHTSRFLVVLQKIEHLSAVMFLTQMLEPPTPKYVSPTAAASSTAASKRASIVEDGGDISVDSAHGHTHAAGPHESVSAQHPVSVKHNEGPVVHVDALRLIELTGRTYSVMQSAEKDQLLLTDDALQLYRQFGRLRGLDITPHISIVQADSFPTAVSDHAGGLHSEMVVIPWTIPNAGNSTALIDPNSSAEAEKDGLAAGASNALSPFDHIFGTESTNSPMYSHFIRRVFSETQSDLALFVDRGFGSSAGFTPGLGQHIFLPFLGGPDDRLALRLVVQLCQHANVSATVVRVTRDEEDSSSEAESSPSHKTETEGEGVSEGVKAHQAALQSNQLTVGPSSSVSHAEISERCADIQGHPGTAHRLASETADDLAWAYFTSPSTFPPRSAAVEAALHRISFFTQKTNTPLAHAYTAAEQSVNTRARQWRPLLIVAGRGRRGATINLSEEASKWLSERSLNPSIGAELRKTVGDVATALILGGGQPSSASFLVVEAKA
jgi:hypothetical protein